MTHLSVSDKISLSQYWKGEQTSVKARSYERFRCSELTGAALWTLRIPLGTFTQRVVPKPVTQQTLGFSRITVDSVLQILTRTSR